MHIKGKGKILSALAGAAATLAIVACTAAASDSNPNSGGGSPNSNLQNIGNKYPDYYQDLMNVQGQPTIGIMCFGGVAIMTTSRDQSAAAAQPLPGLNAFCRTQIGSRFSVTGNQDDEPRYARVP